MTTRLRLKNRYNIFFVVEFEMMKYEKSNWGEKKYMMSTVRQNNNKKKEKQ